MTKEKLNIYQKLSIIQANLKVLKDQNCEYGGFKFRSAEKIYEHIKPMLGEYNLSLFVTDKMQEIGGKNYIIATAVLICSETKEKIEVEAVAREGEKDGTMHKKLDLPQITGLTSSYAKKYALCGMFLIDNGLDADKKSQLQPQGEAKPADIKPETLKELDKISEILITNKIKTKKVIDNYIKSAYGANNLNELSEKNANEFIAKMEPYIGVTQND